jgi:hypothetical protein
MFFASAGVAQPGITPASEMDTSQDGEGINPLGNEEEEDDFLGGDDAPPMTEA